METGFFEELSPSSVDIFAPKYVYIVNRRCNIQEIPGDLPVRDSSHRYVSIKFHLDPGFINYTIHDLKTNSKYYTTTNGWFTIYLKAGEGTLLKIEPTVQAGGYLVENESVSYQVNVKSDLKLGNNSRKGSIARGLLQVQNAIFEENPIVLLDSIASEYAKKLPAEQALYKKAVYQLMVQNDRKGAKISRLKLETDFPESHLLADLNLLLSDTMTARNSTINQGLGKANSDGVVTVEYDYNLYNNYPNPFNPETVIKFSLKEKSSVTLTVYNITGQKVVELVNGEMEKGLYEKRFDGTNLSSGVYIFRLSAQSLEHSNTNYTKTMKALLLK